MTVTSPAVVDVNAITGNSQCLCKHKDNRISEVTFLLGQFVNLNPFNVKYLTVLNLVSMHGTVGTN